MTYTLELENKEDFAKVKKFLEQIKGAKITDNEDETEFYEDGTPKWFIDKLADYADNLKEEDFISAEEFMESARRKVCELSSRK